LQPTLSLGEDLEDQAVIDRHASASGVDLAKLSAALADGSAIEAVAATAMIARQHGVQGTPAWLSPQGMITGLRPAPDFERLANEARWLAQ
jgi:predicted DsbA family dithiol-disulfide isomerase